jgi:hypothetical protein
MLTNRHAYDETVFAQQEIQNQHRLQQRLMQQAKKHGFQLIPIAQN